MKKTLFLLVFGLITIITQSSFAVTTSVPCGVNKECPGGYTCEMAMGSLNSGFCSPSPFATVMCAFIENYFGGKLMKIIILFALIMLGLAFFLGKISWGMIISVFIGVALIYGAGNIVQHKLNYDSTLFCSTIDNVRTSCYANEVVNSQSEGGKIISSSKNQYNTSQSNDHLGVACGLLECQYYECNTLTAQASDDGSISCTVSANKQTLMLKSPSDYSSTAQSEAVSKLLSSYSSCSGVDSTASLCDKIEGSTNSSSTTDYSGISCPQGQCNNYSCNVITVTASSSGYVCKAGAKNTFLLNEPSRYFGAAVKNAIASYIANSGKTCTISGGSSLCTAKQYSNEYDYFKCQSYCTSSSGGSGSDFIYKVLSSESRQSCADVAMSTTADQYGNGI